MFTHHSIIDGTTNSFVSCPSYIGSRYYQFRDLPKPFNVLSVAWNYTGHPQQMEML